jgi:hypothetical protein
VASRRGLEIAGLRLLAADIQGTRTTVTTFLIATRPHDATPPPPFRVVAAGRILVADELRVRQVLTLTGAELHTRTAADAGFLDVVLDTVINTGRAEGDLDDCLSRTGLRRLAIAECPADVRESPLVS